MLNGFSHIKYSYLHSCHESGAKSDSVVLSIGKQVFFFNFDIKNKC